MLENVDILKELKPICDSLQKTLSDRSLAIKDKEVLIDNIKASISDAKAKGVETKSMESTLKMMENDLINFVNNEDDLIKENIFIIDASESIRNFSGWSNNGYKTQSKLNQERLERKNNIESSNKEYEEKLKSIKEDTDEKKKLRADIVENESVLESLKGDFSSFEGTYSVVIKGVDDYDSKIEKLNKEINVFEGELDELNFEIESGNNLLSDVHRNFVDYKMGFNALDQEVGELEHINNTYGTSSIELRESVQISDDVKSELEQMKAKEIEIEEKLNELKDSKNSLVEKLNKKEAEVTNLSDEKKILENTNEVKELDIKTLNGKIKAWESNYTEFEKLVNNLEDYVGYPKYSNAEGDDVIEGQNPLEPLIDRLKGIIDFVESKEFVTQEEVEDSRDKGLDLSLDLNVSPYLLGAAALGVILIAKR